VAVNCPYCGAELAKMPARKKRCPSCSQPIYVKSTPEDRTKRLMTASQAKAAEDAWHMHGVRGYTRQKAENTLALIGVSSEQLNHLLESTGWELSVAVEACLFAAIGPESTMTRHHKKCAHWAIAKKMIETGDARWQEHMAQSIREELADWQERGALGVRVRKPSPWPPAASMLEMHAFGASVEEIATATGYSAVTVKRNLESRGNDPRTGPHCDRHAGRVFSFAQALDAMPLPCGETCICSWSPVLACDFAPTLQTK